MKKILIFICLLASYSAYAEDVIQIVPLKTTAGVVVGDRQSFQINMLNETKSIRAIEMRFTLPEGMTLIEYSNNGHMECRRSALSNRFPVDYDDWEGTTTYYYSSRLEAESNNTYHLAIWPSNPNVTVSGTDGTLLSVYYTTNSEMESGVYPIIISETVLSLADKSSVNLSNSSSYVIISDNTTTSKLDMNTLTGYVPSFVVEQLNADLLSNENLTIVNLSGATELGADLVTPDNVVSVVGTKGTLKREFTAKYWSTVCLPFPLNATQVAALNEEGVEIEEFTGFDETAGTVTFEPVTTMEANTPYIVKSETTQSPFTNLANVQLSTAEMNNVVVGKMTFMGTFEKQTLNSSTNTIYYAYNASDGNFVRIGSNATVPPFRAYLKLDNSAGNSAGARSFIVNHGDGEATGISTQLQGYSKTGGRYNLLGMPQAENSKVKGIYIQNGQKIVVR